MDTWSRPEQSWTKPPQTREDIAKKPFSSWTKRCKKSRQASRTIKSDRSKRKLLFSIWEQFWWAISLDRNEIAAPERRKERSAWASSRTTAEAPQTIAIFSDLSRLISRCCLSVDQSVQTFATLHVSSYPLPGPPPSLNITALNCLEVGPEYPH